MPLEILKLSSTPPSEQPALSAGARRIFEETAPSLRTLSAEDQLRFERKYFGIYLENPEWIFLAINSGQILGYLAGAPLTLPVHFSLNPYLERFRSEIEQDFPAHLHLNLTEGARGMGLGTKLISRFLFELRTLEPFPCGVHIVTSPDSENVRFYLKNGFERTKQSGNFTLIGKHL